MPTSLDRRFDDLMSVDDFDFEHLLDVAGCLDSNPSYVPRFCSRYILESRRKRKIWLALETLAWVKHYDPAIKEASLFVLGSSTLSRSVKTGALHVLAHHADSLTPRFISQLIRGLPEEWTVSCLTALLSQLPYLSPDARLRVLLSALRSPLPNDHNEKWSFGTSIIDLARVSTDADWARGGPTNEELYRDGIRKVRVPHLKALLMLGLLRTKKKEYEGVELAVQELAAKDRLTDWFYQKYLVVYRNPANASPSAAFSPAVIQFLKSQEGDPASKSVLRAVEKMREPKGT